MFVFLLGIFLSARDENLELILNKEKKVFRGSSHP